MPKRKQDTSTHVKTTYFGKKEEKKGKTKKYGEDCGNEHT